MDVSGCIRAGDFRRLFIEHLGWERVDGSLEVANEGEVHSAIRIAHKRGFTVFELCAPRHLVQTRPFVRQLQGQLLRLAHEHLLIARDNANAIQVWAWSFTDRSTGRRRQRVHAGFNARLLPALVRRIERLSFSLDEEETVTLIDVAERVSEGLNAETEQEIFFRRPAYAKQCNKLVPLMRTGGIAAEHEFVLLHRPLARWFARRFDPEKYDWEDLEQIAVIALIRAARLYDPGQGTSFSTYAYRAMQTHVIRRLPEFLRLGNVPYAHYLAHRRVVRRSATAFATGGPQPAIEACKQAWLAEGLSLEMGDDLFRFISDSSDIGHVPYLGQDVAVEFSVRLKGWAPFRNPVNDLAYREMCDVLENGILALPEREQRIIRARFGWDGVERTLEDIGTWFNVTKERIRQIELRIMDHLHAWMQANWLDDKQPNKR